MQLVSRSGFTDAIGLFGRIQAATHEFGHGMAETAPGVAGEAGDNAMQIVGEVNGGSHQYIVMY